MLRTALLALTFAALAAAPAAAHRSPADCTASGLGVTLTQGRTLIRNGDTVDYAVRVSNSASGACDVSDASFTLLRPTAAGTPGGPPLSLGAPATFAAGAALATHATNATTVLVDPGVETASASVAGTYVVHDGSHSSASVSRSLNVDVTQPLLTLALTATPNSGIVPLEVAYDFLLTNVSTTVVPMSNPLVTSAGCSPIVRGGGDTNGNDLLDSGEGWHFSCAAEYTKPGTANTNAFASATSTVDGLPVNAVAAPVSVTMTAPPRPHLTLTKTADPASGFVPFTVTYTYDVLNDSDANARPLTNVSITDPDCAPAVPANADIPRGEHRRFTCAKPLTAPRTLSSSAIAIGTDTFDGALVYSAASGVGVTALAPVVQGPPTQVAEEEPAETAKPTPSKRVVFSFTSRFSRPCGGGVALTLKAGRTVVARKTVKPDRTCRYRVRFDVLRSRLRGASSVTVSSKLGKRSASRRLPTPG